MNDRGFLNLLSATEIGSSDGRSVWRLNEPLVFMLSKDRKIIIPALFESDLASVPRLPIIYGIWGDRAHREAILHDYCYRIDAKIFNGDSVKYVASRGDADWYFRMAMISRGRSWFIYQPMFWAVVLAGSGSYHRMKVMDKFPLDYKE